MFAAVETVTKADPVRASRRHKADVAAQAPAGEPVHAAPPLTSSGRGVYNEPPRASIPPAGLADATAREDALDQDTDEKADPQMLCWTRKRRFREQTILLHQNALACTYLKGVFDTDGNAYAVADIVRLEYENREIARSVVPPQLASPEAVEGLLEINKTLRRLYDQTPAQFVSSFDRDFVPVGGWDAYLERYGGRAWERCALRCTLYSVTKFSTFASYSKCFASGHSARRLGSLSSASL